MQMTEIDLNERVRRRVVLEASKVSQIPAHTDVAAKESHHAAAKVDTDVGVGD